MRRDLWRLGELVREATLNVINPRSKMIATLIVATVLGSACAAFYAFESERFSEQLITLESRGANIVSFRAASPDADISISRKSCEGLSRVRGVKRAGLLKNEGSRDVPEIGAKTTIFTASATLFPGLSTSDGLIGMSLVGEGVRTVTLAPSDTRALSAAPRQPEGIPTNAAIVLPLAADSSSGSQCVVELARFQNSRIDIPTLASQLDVRGGSIVGRVQLRLTTDPVAEWANRPGQFVGVAGGAIGGLLASLLVWTRSSEVATYRLSGTNRRSLALLLTIESLLASGVFAFSGALAVWTVRSSSVSTPEVLYWLFAGSASWWVAALLGTMRSIAVSPAAMTRER
ncbi:hypothetical protein [Leifsonia sp. 2MCAF36]|uniref:hypothetical protein n=1 Tax=Leifsonia sp. 2MCAF36 TaxID=3232988 RepID=UPI003F9B19EA